MVTNVVVDVELLDVAHQLQGEVGRKDAGVLRLVLLQDVRLNGSTDSREGLLSNLPNLLRQGWPTVLLLENRFLLTDCGVEEHGQNDWSWAVDSHRDTCVAVYQVEAVEQLAHLIDCEDRDSGLPHLSVYVGTKVRVAPVQGDRVECGREAGVRGGFAQQVEALVGAAGRPLAGEHSGRVLVGPLEREDASCVGEVSGQILPAEPVEQSPFVLEAGQGDAWNRATGERFDFGVCLNVSPSDLVGIDPAVVPFGSVGPVGQKVPRARV